MSHIEFLYQVVFPSAIVVGIGLAILVDQSRKRKAKREIHDKVAAAKDKILADGKVEGPKGPYAPHKKWNTGLGMGTPTETEPAKEPGYHGTPWS